MTSGQRGFSRQCRLCPPIFPKHFHPTTPYANDTIIDQPTRSTWTTLTSPVGLQSPDTEGSDRDELYDNIAKYVTDVHDRVLEIAKTYPSVDINSVVSIGAESLDLVLSLGKARSLHHVDQQDQIDGGEEAENEVAEGETYALPTDVTEAFSAWKSKVDAFLTNPPQAPNQHDDNDGVGSDQAEAGSA
jgi:hypothetical protein